jgi:hypothetical protein
LEDDGFKVGSGYFYAYFVYLLQVILGEFCEVVRGMDVIFRFPTVTCFAISFPPDQVLMLSPAVKSHIQHLVHFILLFPINKVRWGFFEIGPMFFCLLVRR